MVFQTVAHMVTIVYGFQSAHAADPVLMCFADVTWLEYSDAIIAVTVIVSICQSVHVTARVLTPADAGVELGRASVFAVVLLYELQFIVAALFSIALS